MDGKEGKKGEGRGYGEGKRWSGDGKWDYDMGERGYEEEGERSKEMVGGKKKLSKKNAIMRLGKKMRRRKIRVRK